MPHLPVSPAALFCPAERIALNGSALVVTPNASLSIEGTAGPLVIASAGICNLRLPSDNAWVPSQPCRITGEPPLAQAGEGAAAVAQQAGAFNQTCHFDRDANSEQGSWRHWQQCVCGGSGMWRYWHVERGSALSTSWCLTHAWLHVTHQDSRAPAPVH